MGGAGRGGGGGAAHAGVRGALANGCGRCVGVLMVTAVGESCIVWWWWLGCTYMYILWWYHCTMYCRQNIAMNQCTQ